jgi:hypothetical protein
VIVCLTEQHIAHLGEDETLRDLEEGGQMGNEIGTGSSDLYVTVQKKLNNNNNNNKTTTKC